MFTRLALAAAVALAAGAPCAAWDRLGHMVVDRIAWDHMNDAARIGAVELLSRAPADSGLYLRGATPRENFVQAGYWADVVRDEALPLRKERYDHPTWHYVNRFWRDGEMLSDRGTLGDLVDRLRSLDPSHDPVDLAWYLHLVGDVHQPLHSSGRVTGLEPEGDRGGNDFVLDDPEAPNLHAFWDSILRRAYPKHHSESRDRWLARVAGVVAAHFPFTVLSDEVGEPDYESWSEDAAKLAMAHAYPDDLARNARPPERYAKEVVEISERQIALAGYRLAARLNALFR